MTLALEDIRTAAQALAAEAVQPSGNTLVRYFHTRGQRLSKRTALAHLRALADAGEVFPPARPAPVPLSSADDDPVYHGASAAVPAPVPVHKAMPVLDPVTQAEAALAEARDDLLQLKGYFFCTKDLLADGILHGSLHPHDPIHQQALADVDAAKRAYDLAWQALTEARQSQAQRQAAQQQQAREAWVQQHRPEVLRELQRTEQTYTRVQALPEDSSKPKAHYAARHLLQTARQAYQAALAMAPTANGASH